MLNARDINGVIGEVVEKHRALAETKSQTLVFEPGDNLPQIMIDPWLIDHALSHVLGNALTYTPEQGTITVRTGIEGQQEIIVVEDDGEGIPSEALPHIFDHFYRVDPARSTTTGGSGLGLSIVRKIIEAHRGTITVSSEAGKGSTFRIALPIAELTASGMS
jgi:two-component system sensor histidine kinase BaeS